MLKKILVAGLIAGVAVVPAASSAIAGSVKCTAGWAGHDASCPDPVGDVEGGPGPDITRVEQGEWGVVFFDIVFAKTPPLARSAAFTDTLSVLISTTAPKARYVLSASASDLRHGVLRRLPDGKRVRAMCGSIPAASVFVRGKQLRLGTHLCALGNPSVIRFRVKAARQMLDGTPGGRDLVPDVGSMVWRNG